MKFFLTLFLAVFAAAFPTAVAEIVTLEASRDATIFQNNVNNSNGSGAGLFAGTAQGTNVARRSLLAFDFTSIPAGAIISQVRLTLTLGQIAGNVTTAGTARTFSLSELTRDWGEGTTYSTTSGIGGTGQGTMAGSGDATWNAAKYPSTLWTTAGGDFDPVASATRTTPAGFAVGSSLVFDSNASLVADARGWFADPATNFGWLLKNNDETTAQSFFAFYSSEYSDASQGDPALEPKLLVTYEGVPEPSTWAMCMIAAGLLGFGLRQRRSAARG